MKRIARSLEKAYTNGQDLEAREDMAMASLLGGMALANVKLGAVHGFAGPMGGMFPIPHGEICACLLPAVMKINYEALKNTKNKQYLLKYSKVAQIFTDKNNTEIELGIEQINGLVKRLGISTLSEFGITSKDFPELVEKAKNSSSMKGNPIKLEDNQLFRILEKSL
jgi:alcohol dehydrogenase class IV